MLCGQKKNMKFFGMPERRAVLPEPEEALLHRRHRIDDGDHRQAAGAFRVVVVVARVDEQALREEAEADREHVGVPARSPSISPMSTSSPFSVYMCVLRVAVDGPREQCTGGCPTRELSTVH